MHMDHCKGNYRYSLDLWNLQHAAVKWILLIWGIIIGVLLPSSMSRLDRFLVSPDWEEHFSNVHHKLFPRPLSDHFPILLDISGLPSVKGSFKFENMWLNSGGICGESEIMVEPDFWGASKLYLSSKTEKSLKKDFGIWNKDVFGDVRVKKTNLLSEISRLDRLEADRVLSIIEKGRLRQDLVAWRDELVLSPLIRGGR